MERNAAFGIILSLLLIGMSSQHVLSVCGKSLSAETQNSSTITNGVPAIHVEPTLMRVNPTESFTVNISIQDVVDLFSYEAKVGFDKAVLEPIAIEEGPFIKNQTSSPMGTFFLPIVEQDFVHVACVTLGNYPGVSGNGTLFSVTFNVIEYGISDLHIYDSVLLDSNVMKISHNTIDGRVLATILGDVNGDGIVNILDLTIVSLSYGSFKDEPGYNPEADINEDGIVDMRDLAIVARRLGVTNP